MISCFFVWIQNRFRWLQPTSHSLNMIKGNSRIQLLQILIVEGVDAFEMLMIVILELLVANFWKKLLCFRDTFSVKRNNVFHLFWTTNDEKMWYNLADFKIDVKFRSNILFYLLLAYLCVHFIDIENFLGYIVCYFPTKSITERGVIFKLDSNAGFPNHCQKSSIVWLKWKRSFGE